MPIEFCTECTYGCYCDNWEVLLAENSAKSCLNLGFIEALKTL
jgi:hypothetical protein